MRSASSSTRHSTSPRRSALLWTRSSSRPGVATRTSTPLRSARTCAAHRHAADRQRGAHAQMTAVGAEAVEDLAGQFARRAEHQDAAALALRRPWIGGEVMQDRQRERGSLAGAGLGNSDHIAARHHDRNGLRLDRGGGDVFFFGECAGDRFVECEVVQNWSNELKLSVVRIALQRAVRDTLRPALRVKRGHPARSGLSVN